MTTPPFSPILLGGLLMRAVPTEILQPIADGMARRLQDRHPGVFERLNPLGPRRFLIDVVDLPWIFLLSVAEGKGAVAVLRKNTDETADATIRAPLKVLFGLLDGSIDGDAMFFTRDMTFEGDTEAVVALRNALDGADIDLVADLAESLGPLKGGATRLSECLLAAYARLDSDLSTVGDALTQPAVRRAEAQARRIDELETRCAQLEKALRRTRSVPT